MGSARRAPLPFPLPDDLSGTKIGRFVVGHKLGAGGMGEVYYAEDTKLHRPVALKRLFPELRPSSKTRQRILHEAQRASALSSEYIASVYDVLEDDDEILLVMEYVDGSTLRRRLETIGRLPLNSFLPVAVQCAEALAEAQQKGVLHRDIKPENIMLTAADHVKILDFGLARQFPVASPTAMTVSTESRSLGCVGTLGYMAPEVLLEQELDARTDLFSLGIVFYEMLTGRHPFDTHKPVATADHILHAQPPPMKTLVAEVPEELERIVLKMLAKSPEDRYATAADLLVDLRAVQHEAGHPSKLPVQLPIRRWLKTASRLGIALMVVLLVLSALSALSRHWKPWLDISELPVKKNLAVLPFAAAGSDADARAFSQGLTETLTAKLSQLTDRYPLQVVSPSEIRALATASVEQARAGLGVNLVLEGSFHQSGTKVRVNYNLVDAQTQRVLRADTITADAADPFALEDKVVDSALRALDLELSAQERNGLASRGTSQPVAYDFYVRGRGYLQEYQKPENIESAIQLFTRALESDPNFALGYAGLGESYWQKYKHTHDGQWVAKALEACQRANTTGFGYNCLGTVYNGTGKYEDAATEFQHVLQTDRTNDDAYRGLAFAYEHLGKMTEAEDTYRRAISARPEYWAGYSWLGAFFYRGARYDEAAQMFAQVIKLAPDNARGYSNLCGAYIMAARYGEAVPACEQSARITPIQDAYSNLGTAYFYQRRFPEASWAYEKAVKLDDRQRSSWGNLADAYYWYAGHRQDSVAAYRRAIALGEEELHVNPRDALLLSYLAVYHAMLQEKQLAWANLNQALALDSAQAEVQLNAALVANQLEDQSTAMRSLRKARDAGIPATLILSYPNFDDLQSHQQFEQLLQEKKPAMQSKRPQ